MMLHYENDAENDEEWRKTLTPEQFHVLREHGTERAGTSPLNHEKREGRIRMRRLRSAALHVGHEIRKRQRLAELLSADRRRHRNHDGSQLRDDAG